MKQNALEIVAIRSACGGQGDRIYLASEINFGFRIPKNGTVGQNLVIHVIKNNYTNYAVRPKPRTVSNNQLTPLWGTITVKLPERAGGQPDSCWVEINQT
jgi:hypothetical protein